MCWLGFESKCWASGLQIKIGDEDRASSLWLLHLVENQLIFTTKWHHGVRDASLNTEGMFAWRAPSAPNIQMNVPAIYHNALPPNITTSSSSGTPSTSKLYDCWQSNNFPFFRPTNGMIRCTLPL